MAGNQRFFALFMLPSLFLVSSVIIRATDVGVRAGGTKTSETTFKTLLPVTKISCHDSHH